MNIEKGNGTGTGNGIDEIKMVNVIKIFIFYHKVNGENGEKSLFDWL